MILAFRSNDFSLPKRIYGVFGLGDQNRFTQDQKKLNRHSSRSSVVVLVAVAVAVVVVFVVVVVVVS